MHSRIGEPLLQFFGRAKASEHGIRSFVVKIDTETESLELDHDNLAKSTNWEEDFVTFVEKLPLNLAPCYVFFGHDHKEWTLICWIPDDAPVLEKMLYSSTKAELIKQFGLDVIKYRISWSYNQPLSLKEYKLHVAAEGTDSALTLEERERKEAEKNEIAHTGLHMQNQNFQGIDFKISACAEQSLSKFSSDEINLSCLTIDLEKEQIELKQEESRADPEAMVKLCSGPSCYMLYRFSARSPAGETVPFVCEFLCGRGHSLMQIFVTLTVATVARSKVGCCTQAASRPCWIASSISSV
ncbi:Twinfilin-1 [Cichlidogyrus casuarinus]|uniref:Twinfilin-1 n=1 Tax=Cichlidogyrus casuarinus TaxID=1844966 RepID=A0ABD2PRH5_9PLAT